MGRSKVVEASRQLLQFWLCNHFQLLKYWHVFKRSIGKSLNWSSLSSYLQLCKNAVCSLLSVADIQNTWILFMLYIYSLCRYRFWDSFTDHNYCCNSGCRDCSFAQKFTERKECKSEWLQQARVSIRFSIHDMHFVSFVSWRLWNKLQYVNSMSKILQTTSGICWSMHVLLAIPRFLLSNNCLRRTIFIAEPVV